MKYELKNLNGFTYIHYVDEKENLDFTNSEYFVIDILSDVFKEIMQTTGGFVAEMTTRMIKNLNLQRCNRIMFCQSPAKTNVFQFQFVYLDTRNCVLNIEWSNNYYDYQYFKKKFSECIIEEGIIFDLFKLDYLKEVWSKFEKPSIDFNIKINDREITPNDILICTDLCFLKEEYIESFRHYGVTHAELSHHYDCLNAAHYKARFIKEDGSYLLDWQGKYNKETIEEFREEYGEENSYDLEPFEASIALYIIRHLADHFTIKNV